MWTPFIIILAPAAVPPIVSSRRPVAGAIPPPLLAEPRVQPRAVLPVAKFVPTGGAFRVASGVVAGCHSSGLAVVLTLKKSRTHEIKKSRNQQFKKIRKTNIQSKHIILGKNDSRLLPNTTNSENNIILREQFYMLCRGERIRPLQYENVLRCFYLHHYNAFLKLGPFKLESSNTSPSLVIFHDFFHNKEINAFIDYAKPSLTTSKYYQGGGKDNTTAIRTSEHTWAYNWSFREAGAVSNRISLVTLQNTTADFTTGEGGGEPFQVI